MIVSSSRRLATLALGAVLLTAGCGDRGNASLLRAFGNLAVFEAGRALRDAPPSRTLSREQANAIPGALVLVSIEGGTSDPLVAIAANGARVTYANAARQSVTLDGAQVVRSSGLGGDATNYRSERLDDPIVTPRPVIDWPTETARLYFFLDAFSQDFVRAATCLVTSIKPETIEIVQLTYATVRVDETCRTPFHEFENQYWVDADSGRVWKSRQWLGPENPRIEIAVVTPFRAQP